MVLKVLMEKHGPDFDDAFLRDMVYGEAVVKEALRNVTPFSGDRARTIAVFILQKAVKTFELEGYQVPKGWMVLGNLFQVMQNDPRWKGKTDDMAPERFCPERWLQPEVIEGGAGSWIPFGGGPRMCIGLPLAMTEVKVSYLRPYKWTSPEARVFTNVQRDLLRFCLGSLLVIIHFH